MSVLLKQRLVIEPDKDRLAELNDTRVIVQRGIR